MKTHRIHFEDFGQDFIYVDVESLGLTKEDHLAIIVGVSPCASPVYEQTYLNKAVDLSANTVGSNFEYADPSRGFVVTKTALVVREIEELEGGES